MLVPVAESLLDPASSDHAPLTPCASLWPEQQQREVLGVWAPGLRLQQRAAS